MSEKLKPEVLEFYLEHPAAFVEDLIGAEPTDQQRAALGAIGSGEKPIAIKAGHGVGKTTLEAWTILWFLFTHPNAKVPCSAPTQHQLEDVLWPEVGYWLKSSPVLSQILEYTKSKLFMRGYEESWFAVPRSSNKAENLQGFHAEHLLFVLDEASGIEDEIFSAVQGALTNTGALLLMCGNPTRVSGFFHDAFHKDRDQYETFTFSCLDSPRVSPEYAERIAKKFGEDSNIYRVRVLGEFPDGEDDSFIPLSIVEQAMQRRIESEGDYQLGVDPARFGSDSSVVCTRRGRKTFPLVSFNGIDTSRLAGEVCRIVRDIRKTGYTKKIRVCVDDTGVGGGVTDQLRLQATELNIEVVPVSFGGKGDDEHANLTAVMYDHVKRLLPEIEIPDDDELVSELSTRLYGIDPAGRIRLETKDEMKRRGLHSPDRADAFVLAYHDEEEERRTLGREPENNEALFAILRNGKYWPSHNDVLGWGYGW